MKQVNEPQQQSQHHQHNTEHFLAAHKIAIRPKWAVLIGILAIGGLYTALSEQLTLGPSWLPLVVELVLLIPIIIAWTMRRPFSYHIIRIFSLLILGVVTIALISSVVLLVITLESRQQAQAKSLLRDAALLWTSNIIVFGLWYWEIDGGGPLKRHLLGHQAADFMFPQQADGNKSGWVPHFLDYIFVAFTGATALSPTDTYPLSLRAKGLMMIEAIISLIIIILLAARAVNIL